MSWVLRNLSYAFHFKHEDSVAEITNPLLKLTGLIITFIALTNANVSYLVILAVVILVEAFYVRRVWNLIKITQAMIMPLAFVAFFAFIFYGIAKMVELVLRLLLIGWIIIIFTTTTLPSKLAQALESIGVPRKVIIIPELAMRVVPYLASDAQQAIECMLLRKEIKLSPIPRGISKIFATIIISAIKRSNALTEALLAKHYFSGRTTKFYEFKITVYGILQLIVKTFILILIILHVDIMHVLVIILRERFLL